MAMMKRQQPDEPAGHAGRLSAAYKTGLRVGLAAVVVAGSGAFALSEAVATTASEAGRRVEPATRDRDVTVVPRTEGRPPPETPSAPESPAEPPAAPPAAPAAAPSAEPTPTPTPSSGIVEGAVAAYLISISVKPPVPKDASTMPPPVQPLGKADTPPPGKSKVVLGDLVANCTTTQSPKGVMTSCGKEAAPPKEGAKLDPTKKLYCNSLPKPRSAPLAGPLPGPVGLMPGLYVSVLDGIINLSNRGGSRSFSAGQFGYTASVVQPPLVIPTNPGITFNPPPAFSPAPSGTSPSASKPTSVDCEVRSMPRSAALLEPAIDESTPQGSVVFINAGGLRPQSAVSVYLLSAPNAALGDFAADAEGNLAAWVRMPIDAATGPNVLQVNGFTAEGYTASISTGITVRAAVESKARQQVYFGYLSTKLTKAARASLDDTLAMIPVGMPNICSVTPVTRGGEVIPSLLDLATSRATATAKYLTDRGLTCSVARTQAATEAVTYRARRANVAITYGH
jgi:hypothetical protein